MSKKSKYFTWVDLSEADIKKYGNGDSDDIKQCMAWSRKIADKTGCTVTIYEDTGRGEEVVMKVKPLKNK